MSKITPAWRKSEQIAALFERMLSPGATVEHDVRLPGLGGVGERQCDVVIRYGTPPRQTTAIVEVQRRNARTKISEFQSWIQKMRDVGAQHLYCVSMHEYSKSIVHEVATRHGPTVRLMTLAELSSGGVPGVHLVQFEHNIPTLHLRFVGTPRLRPQPQVGFLLSWNDQVYRIGDGERRYSLNELTKVLSDLQPDPLATHFAGDIGSIPDLRLERDGIAHQVLSLPIEVEISREVTRMPLQFFAYEQMSSESSTTWLATATAEIEGVTRTFSLVFRPRDSDGRLEVVGTEAKGARWMELPGTGRVVELRDGVWTNPSR
jgi:hypothetical protein